MHVNKPSNTSLAKCPLCFEHSLSHFKSVQRTAQAVVVSAPYSSSSQAFKPPPLSPLFRLGALKRGGVGWQGLLIPLCNYCSLQWPDHLCVNQISWSKSLSFLSTPSNNSLSSPRELNNTAPPTSTPNTPHPKGHGLFIWSAQESKQFLHDTQTGRAGPGPTGWPGERGSGRDAGWGWKHADNHFHHVRNFHTGPLKEEGSQADT